MTPVFDPEVLQNFMLITEQDSVLLSDLIKYNFGTEYLKVFEEYLTNTGPVFKYLLQFHTRPPVARCHHHRRTQQGNILPPYKTRIWQGVTP